MAATTAVRGVCPSPNTRHSVHDASDENLDSLLGELRMPMAAASNAAKEVDICSSFLNSEEMKRCFDSYWAKEVRYRDDVAVEVLRSLDLRRCCC